MVDKVASLANTGKKYFKCGVRMKEGRLHIQIKTRPGNRYYGYAFDAEVPADFEDWLRKQERTVLSLANTGEKYFSAQVRKIDADTLHLQGASSVHFNRGYGASINLKVEGLGGFPY